MKKVFNLLTLFAAAALLAGCGEQTPSTSGSSSGSSESSSQSTGSTGSSSTSGSSTSTPKTVRSFTINFNDSAWKSAFAAGVGLEEHVDEFKTFLNSCNTFGDEVISSATPYNVNSTAQGNLSSVVAATIGSGSSGGSLHFSFKKQVKSISLGVESYWKSYNSGGGYEGCNYDTACELYYGETTVESTWKSVDLAVSSSTEGPAKSATVEMLEEDGPFNAFHLQTNLDAVKGRVKLCSMEIEYYAD